VAIGCRKTYSDTIESITNSPTNIVTDNKIYRLFEKTNLRA